MLNKDVKNTKYQNLEKLEPISGIEPPTSSLPRKCSTPELYGQFWSLFKKHCSFMKFSSQLKWSGKRGSNPRPSAWKADALAN